MLKRISGFYLISMYIVFGLAGLYIYGWTIQIGNVNWGLMGAIIAFFTPFLSQFALILILWFGSGHFINEYSGIVITYALSYYFLVGLVGAYFKKLK